MLSVLELWCKRFLNKADAAASVIKAFGDAAATGQRALAFVSQPLLYEREHAVLVQSYGNQLFINELPLAVAEDFGLFIPRCRCGVIPYVGGVVRRAKVQELFSLDKFEVQVTRDSSSKRSISCSFEWRSGGTILSGTVGLLLTLNLGTNDQAIIVPFQTGTMTPNGRLTISVNFDGLSEAECSAILFAELLQVGTATLASEVVSNPALQILRL